MTATIPSTALSRPRRASVSNTERLALAGSRPVQRPAGLRAGLTRVRYPCQRHQVRLFAARRADIECFARDLEARGPRHHHPSAVTIAEFYRYVVEEELLDHSPAAHVRRPGSIASPMRLAWTATSWAPWLVAAGLRTPAEMALISLLALNGLRCWRQPR